MSRLDEVKNRLKELKSLKAVEKLSPEPSQSYIDDLDLTIDWCNRELKFLNKNPSGVEFVNGV